MELGCRQGLALHKNMVTERVQVLPHTGTEAGGFIDVAGDCRNSFLLPIFPQVTMMMRRGNARSLRTGKM
jgi:hypothetical protein